MKRAQSSPIGLSAPWIDGREEELVLETLRSGQLSLPPPRVEAPYVAAVQRDGRPPLGLAQLERYDEILAARSEVAARYEELLGGVDGVEAPLPDDADHRRSWFVYVVKLATGADRNGVIGRLAEDGVASKPYLPSIHLRPYYRERFGYREGMLPVSEDASARTLALRSIRASQLRTRSGWSRRSSARSFDRHVSGAVPFPTRAGSRDRLEPPGRGGGSPVSRA